MFPYSHTKITATIGPACSSKEVLKQLIEEGVDVCRLNLSHGTHVEHKAVINFIHELNQELGSNVAILADLQGPKLRIGDVEGNSIELKDGSLINLVNTPCIGTPERLYLSYGSLPKDIQPGEPILIDDGKLKLEVVETNGIDCVKAKVIHGGILSSKKGVNLPSTKISLPSLTEKDIADAEFLLGEEIDWIALSFVRYVTDIFDIKDLIKKRKKNVRVIAKIEKPEALEDIDNIIDLADGIMIARGDLAVEVDFNKVPVLQKEIVRKCIGFGKPVIIATQMLESMITNFRPTRAETNDVANAVLDGADSVMLSGETSVGRYPVEVIRTMQKIIKWTEEKGGHIIQEHVPKGIYKSFLPDSICYNAVKMGVQTKASSIIAFTWSGYTAFRLASHRPGCNIYAFTNNRRILRALSLVWGVRAFYIDEFERIDLAIKFTIDFLREGGFVQEDDVVVHVGSTPISKRGQTNMIKLSYL